ncbi:MAG: alanine racemase [Gemmatimonadaceae bacterium]|nr:alanine racemase [Gemmatimonadaceae bacterium]
MTDILSLAEALAQLETPALLLDLERLDRNIARLGGHLAALGVPLRPHVKTAKSVPIIRRVLEGQPGGVTVSTLREAEACYQAGIPDLLYAVGLAPQKLPHVAALRARGASLTCILDSVAMATMVAEFAASRALSVPVLIEIDSDGHRSGVKPDAPELLQIAAALGDNLRGVLTHAGESYGCVTADAKRAMAEQERAAAVLAAERLRDAGFRCDTVSVGSTPTALFAERLDGVTEVRAGVYVFQDLVMAGIGVCDVDDIAISVLATVIGHQVKKGWLITDAGWMALSRDRGTATQAVDQGYGVVCDVLGQPIDGLVVHSANQEHGIVTARGGGACDLARFPIGTPLRILPNHACATAAQFGEYQVLADGALQVERWVRFNHW